MFENSRVVHVLALFAGASSRREYNAAKREAGRLDPVHQLAIVDAAIDARARVGVRK